MFGVVKHFKRFDLDTPTDKILFEVYRLDDGGTTNPRWTKMNGDIGNLILFLEYNSGSGFGLNASHFAGLNGNCIYFQESNGKRSPNYRIFWSIRH